MCSDLEIEEMISAGGREQKFSYFLQALMDICLACRQVKSRQGFEGTNGDSLNILQGVQSITVLSKIDTVE